MAEESAELIPLEGDALEEARACYRRVFAQAWAEYSQPPAPFWPQLDHRALIYAMRRGVTKVTHVHRAGIYAMRLGVRGDGLAALVDAMETLGEDCFYVTCILEQEPRKYLLVTPEMVPAIRAGAVERHTAGLESAWYSTQGTWGLWEIEDGWAAVGSTSEAFVSTLLDGYPPLQVNLGAAGRTVPGEEIPKEYVRFSRWEQEQLGRGDESLSLWDVAFLEHLYGPEQTRKIIAAAGLPADS